MTGQSPCAAALPHPGPSSRAHRNVKRGHGHVAGLHCQLYTLQQVRGEALGLSRPLAGVPAGAAVGRGVGRAQARGQRSPWPTLHPIQTREAGLLSLSGSREPGPQAPSEVAGPPATPTACADSRAVQDTPAAVGVP